VAHLQAGPDAAVQEQIEALTADNEADFRRRLALPTDPAALAAARGDADQALRTAERYSLPLTPEEEAEVERRSQLGEKIPALLHRSEVHALHRGVRYPEAGGASGTVRADV